MSALIAMIATDASTWAGALSSAGTSGQWSSSLRSLRHGARRARPRASCDVHLSSLRHRARRAGELTITCGVQARGARAVSAMVSLTSADYLISGRYAKKPLGCVRVLGKGMVGSPQKQLYNINRTAPHKTSTSREPAPPKLGRGQPAQIRKGSAPRGQPDA